MNVHLALHFPGINHEYHLAIWQRALRTLCLKSVPMQEADVTVMWGPNPPFTYARERNKPVLMVDFPYWNRGGKHRDGKEFYKISLNGQHPTKYIMKEKHSPDRYLATNGPVIQPWRDGGENIMMAGMGQKAAKQNGYKIGEWESRIIEVIRRQTDKQIIYRVKPKQDAPKIPGTIFDPAHAPIEQELEKTAALVCHHGNPTIAALAMGIPIFMNGPIGAASHFASFDFGKINEPVKPEGREQFFYNISHWQWSYEEIESGKALMSYMERGLLN